MLDQAIEEAGLVEGGCLLRRLPYFACRGHIERAVRREVGERSQCVEDVGRSGEHGQRRGLNDGVSWQSRGSPRSTKSSLNQAN